MSAIKKTNVTVTAPSGGCQLPLKGMIGPERPSEYLRSATRNIAPCPTTTIENTAAAALFETCNARWLTGKAKAASIGTPTASGSV